MARAVQDVVTANENRKAVAVTRTLEVSLWTWVAAIDIGSDTVKSSDSEVQWTVKVDPGGGRKVVGVGGLNLGYTLIFVSLILTLRQVVTSIVLKYTLTNRSTGR